MKRAFIVHGWSGYPEEGWFPWLKKELEKQGFAATVLAMPHPDEPTIDDWVNHVAEMVGTPDTDTYLVGHSVGCQTILRYLERSGGPVGGIVCVGGFFTDVVLESEEEERVGKPWLGTPLDFGKIRRAARHVTAIFSDDDEIVPLESNARAFQENLGATIVRENGKGHFSGSDGVTELPSALQAVVDTAGESTGG